jgi:ubiquitin C-terminal hydrolase
MDFAREEVLDECNKAFCTHCQDFVRSSKKMDVWTAPQILIIQLKRFYSKGDYQRKLDINVEFPDTLDMAPFVIGPHPAGGLHYRLVSVIEHSGGLGGGHYVAVALHHVANKWYRFNDETVKPIKQRDAHTENAYVLFYECQGHIAS